MVIVIFGEHGNGDTYVMTWSALFCFHVTVFYLIPLGLSIRLAIWEDTFYCRKPIEWCDTWFRLALTSLGEIDL